MTSKQHIQQEIDKKQREIQELIRELARLYMLIEAIKIIEEKNLQ